MAKETIQNLPQLIAALQAELNERGYVEDVNVEELPLDELLLYGVLPLCSSIRVGVEL